MNGIPTAAPLRRWIVSPRDPEAEARLSKELGIPALAAAILVQRGYLDPRDIEHFLRPSLDDLHDPALLPDYVKARDAILAARDKKETIFIHGDYDVDGVTSAALFKRFLTSIGCNVVPHVPHRMKEGYGIHEGAVEAARSVGAKLFLTCDCGISAHEQVEKANEAGMIVVVTDHHTVGNVIPNAHAVVNPHRDDSQYPFDELSGAGVVFKLCEGISSDLGYPRDKYCRAFLDLAALGTIADVMPLTGENRVIAKFGLKRLAETKKVGLIELMRAANVVRSPQKPLKAYHVGFVLGPRLNAAGRLQDAALALDLLLENDPIQARQLASEIESLNEERKLEQERIFQEAVEKVMADGSSENDVIVVANENWHSGVIGIVAGKLVEMFRRPVFIASIDPDTGTAKGSARTIPGFNLADAIRKHDHLVSGGGHAMAAGFATSVEQLGDLASSLNDYASAFLTPEDFALQLRVDSEATMDDITFSTVEAISAMEPFGMGNPEPVFCARNVKFAQILPTRHASIMRLLIQSSLGQTVPGILFNGGERLNGWDTTAPVDVLFRAYIDDFNGKLTLKWEVRDFAPAGTVTCQPQLEK
jgi:single-stranded-DNA-specific exonuclease